MIGREQLQQLRSLVLETDQFGCIVDAVGALDSVAGYTAADVVGLHTLDIVAPCDHGMLSAVFVPSTDVLPDVVQPMPFDLTLIGPDGSLEPVHVLPTGFMAEGVRRWIVSMTPRSLRTPAHRMIDLVMAHASLREIAQELVESTSQYTLDSQTGSAVRPFVVMDVGSDEPAVISSGSHPEVDQVLALPEVLATFELEHCAGTIRSLRTGDLAEPLRSVVSAAGFGAVHIGRAHDGGTRAWWVVWLLEKAIDGSARVINADLPRLSALTVADSALQRDRVERILLDATTTDSLTGLGNRRHFERCLRSAAVGSTHCVMYLDLDKFKQINDDLGHDVGDDVLAEVGRRIASVCRSTDATARIGGDEFAVLLADTALDVAGAIAQRLDEAISQPMELARGRIVVTATIGLAMAGSGGDLEDAVRSADMKMLARKRARNAHLVDTVG